MPQLLGPQDVPQLLGQQLSPQDVPWYGQVAIYFLSNAAVQRQLECRWLHRGQLMLLVLQSTLLCHFSLPRYLYSSTWKKSHQTINSLQIEIVSKYCVLQRYSTWFAKNKETTCKYSVWIYLQEKKKLCQCQELTGELLLLPGRSLSEVGFHLLSEQ